MGMHNLMMSNSEEMWESGKNIMDHILKRGGRMSQDFKVSYACILR